MVSQERFCKGPCGLTLPATSEHFYFRKSAKNGKSYPSSYCLKCEKEKSAKKRRDAFSTETGKKRILIQNQLWRAGNPDDVLV